MRVAVVGAGMSGLCVATELSLAGHEVEIIEARDGVGGRAAVVDGVEHCTRIMMDDYSRLRHVLSRIPAANAGESIWQTLAPVRRMVHIERRGWIALDNIYALRRSGLSARDRLELARHRRRRQLLARELRPGPLATLRIAAQLSPLSWIRVAASTLRVRRAFAFPGPTDEYLIDPWATYLRDAGVRLRTATRVERLRPLDRGVELHHSGDWHHHDAAVVAAFVPDALELLRASGIPHRLRVPELGMLSCASTTFVVDWREDLAGRHEARSDEAYLYSGGGFYALYQPGPRRVVAVTTRPGPDAASLLEASRRLLQLRHSVDLTGMRDNLEPASRIFAATPLDPGRIASVGSVHFAGSYLSRTYPLDSGEAAARCAQAATRALLIA